MLDDKHRQRAFERIAEEGRRGEALAAGAQHIGGADVAGAERPDVGRAGKPRQDEAERDRATEIAERQRAGVGERMRPVDRGEHAPILAVLLSSAGQLNGGAPQSWWSLTHAASRNVFANEIPPAGPQNRRQTPGNLESSAD